MVGTPEQLARARRVKELSENIVAYALLIAPMGMMIFAISFCIIRGVPFFPALILTIACIAAGIIIPMGLYLMWWWTFTASGRRKERRNRILSKIKKEENKRLKYYKSPSGRIYHDW